MTVSLEYDPDSGPQGGISRLRRLASFGRYGADVHASARTPCSNSSVGRRQNTVKECSLLAASLSSFYGWVSKQNRSKVVLGETRNPREHKLHVTQQTSAAVKSDAKASTLALSRHSPCKSASKPAKLQQQVQLPSIFTMQGVSANTSCFNSLSYKTSDNQCVHGLVQSSKHVEAASLYLEDSVTLPKSNRPRMSRQLKKPSMSSQVSYPCHHVAAAGSRTDRLQAMPTVKASHHGPCSELHSPSQLISADLLQLPGPQPNEAKPVAAPRQLPELDLQHLTPRDEVHQPCQQDAQHAQHRWHHAQHAQQECHQARHAHQKGCEAQHIKQEWHDAQHAPPESPQTPQTGRSSQSDATHHNHHDSYRSDSTCCDASQSAQADVHQGPALYQLPAADANLLGKDNNAFQHDKQSCQSDASAKSQRLPDATYFDDELHHSAPGGMGTASPKDVTPGRLLRRQHVLARQAQPMSRRTLADITNIADRKPKPAHMVKDIVGCTAASVPDLVTFWEQRTSVRQHQL